MTAALTDPILKNFLKADGIWSPHLIRQRPSLEATTDRW